VYRRLSGNREEGSYVASRNTHVEATTIVIQKPREREPIKTKRTGRKLVPPYIFVPEERQSGRSPYSLVQTMEEDRACEIRNKTGEKVKRPLCRPKKAGRW